MNITVKQRLLITGLLPIVILTMIVVASFRVFGLAENGVNSIYNDRVVPLAQLKRIADAYAVNVIDTVNKANAGLINAEHAFGEVRSAQTIVSDEWSAYLATELTAEEATLVKQAKTLMIQADNAVDGVKQKLGSLSGTVAGQLSEFDGPLYAQIDPIGNTIHELIELQLKVAGEERQRLEGSFAGAKEFFTAGALLAVVLVSLSGWTLYRKVAGSLAAMQGVMSEIEQQNDLTRRLPELGGDEFAATSQVFNRMVAKMANLVGEVRGAALQVAAAAEELSAISGQSSDAIQRQSSETDQVATAINEMTATVQNIAENASLAHQSTEDANKLASDGMTVVVRGRDSIRELETEVQGIAKEMEALEGRAVSIGSVVNVITGIAEQTNLLALNAAIEAARAGEQGRGFAVVADEVRSLAQRTQNSTQEIREAVEGLQAGARRAVDAVRNGNVKAEASADSSRQAADALERISAAMQQIAEMNTQIASAAEEQAAVSNEINERVVSISAIGQETASSASEAATASRDMAELASNLQEMVARFRA